MADQMVSSLGRGTRVTNKTQWYDEKGIDLIATGTSWKGEAERQLVAR